MIVYCCISTVDYLSNKNLYQKYMNNKFSKDFIPLWLWEWAILRSKCLIEWAMICDVLWKGTIMSRERMITGAVICGGLRKRKITWSKRMIEGSVICDALWKRTIMLSERMIKGAMIRGASWKWTTMRSEGLIEGVRCEEHRYTVTCDLNLRNHYVRIWQVFVKLSMRITVL